MNGRADELARSIQLRPDEVLKCRAKSSKGKSCASKQLIIN